MRKRNLIKLSPERLDLAKTVNLDHIYKQSLPDVHDLE